MYRGSLAGTCIGDKIATFAHRWKCCGNMSQRCVENIPMARVLLCQQRFLLTLSLAVRNRGSSLKASLTSLLNLLNRVSNSSTYFSESCKQNLSYLALLQINRFGDMTVAILLIFSDPIKWSQINIVTIIIPNTNESDFLLFKLGSNKKTRKYLYCNLLTGSQGVVTTKRLN